MLKSVHNSQSDGEIPHHHSGLAIANKLRQRKCWKLYKSLVKSPAVLTYMQRGLLHMRYYCKYTKTPPALGRGGHPLEPLCLHPCPPMAFALGGLKASNSQRSSAIDFALTACFPACDSNILPSCAFLSCHFRSACSAWFHLRKFILMPCKLSWLSNCFLIWCITESTESTSIFHQSCGKSLSTSLFTKIASLLVTEMFDGCSPCYKDALASKLCQQTSGNFRCFHHEQIPAWFLRN